MKRCCKIHETGETEITWSNLGGAREVFPAPALPSAARQRPENLDPAAGSGVLHHKMRRTDSQRLPINDCYIWRSGFCDWCISEWPDNASNRRLSHSSCSRCASWTLQGASFCCRAELVQQHGGLALVRLCPSQPVKYKYTRPCLWKNDFHDKSSVLPGKQAH